MRTSPAARGVLLAALGTTLGACATVTPEPDEAGVEGHSTGLPATQIVDGPPIDPVDVSAVPEAVPKVEPLSAYGNPPYYEVNGHRYEVAKSSIGYRERGIASWYGRKFHGERASSGETYDMYAMTAAHKTLPLPTYVEVTNLENGQRLVLRVNDRGPFKDNRLIDLSYSAAVRLGIYARGTGLVEVRAIDPMAQETTPPSKSLGGASPRLFIQVGAFENRDNAFDLRNRLQGTLVPRIRVKPARQEGKPIYRVQVGPLDTVEDADRMAEILTNLGVEDYRMSIDVNEETRTRRDAAK